MISNKVRQSSGEHTDEQSTRDPDEAVFRFAEEYSRALAMEDRQLIEVKRSLLFAELEGYQRFFEGKTKPREPMEMWTQFQRTIRYASAVARIHLTQNPPSEATVETRLEMREQGRPLPRGVDEWIVEETRDD